MHREKNSDWAGLPTAYQFEPCWVDSGPRFGQIRPDWNQDWEMPANLGPIWTAFGQISTAADKCGAGFGGRDWPSAVRTWPELVHRADVC